MRIGINCYPHYGGSGIVAPRRWGWSCYGGPRCDFIICQSDPPTIMVSSASNIMRSSIELPTITVPARMPRFSASRMAEE